MHANLQQILPLGWTVERQPDGLTKIAGFSTKSIANRRYLPDGYVTVSETRRNFALGLSPPRDKKDYKGRGWRNRLYADAIQALQSALEPARQARNNQTRKS